MLPFPRARKDKQRRVWLTEQPLLLWWPCVENVGPQDGLNLQQPFSSPGKMKDVLCFLCVLVVLTIGQPIWQSPPDRLDVRVSTAMHSWHREL